MVVFHPNNLSLILNMLYYCECLTIVFHRHGTWKMPSPYAPPRSAFKMAVWQRVSINSPYYIWCWCSFARHRCVFTLSVAYYLAIEVFVWTFVTPLADKAISVAEMDATKNHIQRTATPHPEPIQNTTSRCERARAIILDFFTVNAICFASADSSNISS